MSEGNSFLFNSCFQEKKEIFHTCLNAMR